MRFMHRSRAEFHVAATSGAVLVLALASPACGGPAEPPPTAPPSAAAHAPHAAESSAAPAPGLLYPGEERFLRNVRQLTFGGENAEAYFDETGERLVFQSTRDGATCDQIYTMRVDGSDVRRVSQGSGRTTCGYFIPGTGRLLYASTHAADPACPPRPDFSQGYVWPVHETYDLYTASPDGGDLRPLLAAPGYDAEATAAVDGSRLVFTSDRDGDLEIYSAAPDGTDLRRLTREPGYDGGAFFDRTGTRIVYRAHHPTGPELDDYRGLLGRHLVRPTRLEIRTMAADGTDGRVLTANGAANFAPYFTPDGAAVIYASNVANPRGRNFDLWLVPAAGGAPLQVTTSEVFEGFPMFSPDGARLVFASNRGQAEPGETNIFIADWIWDGRF